MSAKFEPRLVVSKATSRRTISTLLSAGCGKSALRRRSGTRNVYHRPKPGFVPEAPRGIAGAPPFRHSASRCNERARNDELRDPRGAVAPRPGESGTAAGLRFAAQRLALSRGFPFLLPVSGVADRRRRFCRRVVPGRAEPWRNPDRGPVSAQLHRSQPGARRPRSGLVRRKLAVAALALAQDQGRSRPRAPARPPRDPDLSEKARERRHPRPDRA